MGLRGRSVIMRASHPVQKRALVRRKQIRAVLKWAQDLQEGEGNVALSVYCEAEGVHSRGITKVLKEKKVIELVETVVGVGALHGLKLATSKLVKRLEADQGGMRTGELVQVGAHLAKLHGGAYGPSQEDIHVTTAVQINLPADMRDLHPRKVELVDDAKKELEGLV